MRLLIGALLIFGLMAGQLLGVGISSAANVYIQKGEGGVGLDAALELSETEKFSLALIGCRNVGKSQRVQLGLYVGAGNPPPEFQSIIEHKEESLSLYLCTNEVCEERVWKFFESSTGDTYFTTIDIPKSEAIKSIRIILPKETKKYEYRGNLAGVFKKICR